MRPLVTGRIRGCRDHPHHTHDVEHAGREAARKADERAPRCGARLPVEPVAGSKANDQREHERQAHGAELADCAERFTRAAASHSDSVADRSCAQPVVILPARVVALLAALLLAATAAPASAQGRERVVFVSMLDRSGTARDTVTPEDLIVREDGIPREILRITPATTAMPVAVLIDNSQVVESAIPDIRNALSAFVRLAGPVGPIALITMADRPTILVDYSSDPKTLLAGAARVFAQPMSGPTLLDTIEQAAIGITRRETERAAIVVLGTAMQDVSNVAAERVLDRLRASGASLHAVVLSPTGQGDMDLAWRDRQLVLDRGTRASGGRRIDVLATQAFPDQLSAVATALRRQFRVVYARPETLIPPKRLEVRAARRGMTVLATPARGQSDR